jgi:MtN3 and saliva related transmembrane protein
MIESLGFLAGILTSISQLPQVIKVVKTRDTRSISIWTYIILFFGIMLWLIYGIAQNDYPLIFANSVTLILTSLIIYYKTRFG